MLCRVGITTDPEKRKSYWNNQVIGFKNWRILQKYANKKDAQTHENRAAKKYNCIAHAGGPDTPGIWYVYKFEYTRTK